MKSLSRLTAPLFRPPMVVTLAVAVLIVAGAFGGIAGLKSGGSASTSIAADAVVSIGSINKRHVVGHLGAFYTPTHPSAALTWSPMTSLVEAQRPRVRDDQSNNSIKISRKIVRPGLQLSLTPDTIRNTSSSLSAGDEAPEVTNFENTSKLATRTDADEALKHKLTDEQQLFNSYTGLRGFMAQSWINESVGIQGGLAIPKQQLRDDQQNLRDQMAVGMGVLVNF